MLRSYDPQIGRFLQWDPYDEFASGYVGMGNDPVNLTDPSGGCVTCAPWIQFAVNHYSTLQPVTVIAQKKAIISTVAKVGKITASGQKIGSQIINQAFKKPGFFAQAWNIIKGVGPLLGRAASVIGGVLIPISTGPGASMSPEQKWEIFTTDPSELSDLYIEQAEERLNSGNAKPNDWKLKDEIQRRKTAREGKVHGHHSYPKALGGAADQKLTNVLDNMHTGPDGIHSDLAKFEGGWLRPKKGMTGAKIVEKFGRQKVEEGLRRFYSQEKWKHILEDFENAVKHTANQ